MKRSLLNEKAIMKLTIANKIAEISASLTVTKPAAIGLKRFWGCFLSDLISMESFNNQLVNFASQCMCLWRSLFALFIKYLNGLAVCRISRSACVRG